jgi:hypothetical protein
MSVLPKKEFPELTLALSNDVLLVCVDDTGHEGQPFQHAHLCAMSLAVATCFPF